MLIYHLNLQKENGNPVFFFDRRVLLDSKRKTALQESILCNRHQFEGLITFFIGYNVFSPAPFGRSRGRSMAAVSDGSSDFPCFDFFFLTFERNIMPAARNTLNVQEVQGFCWPWMSAPGEQRSNLSSFLQRLSLVCLQLSTLCRRLVMDYDSFAKQLKLLENYNEVLVSS